MRWCEQWKHVGAMLASSFAMAITNVVNKKLLDDGVNHLVIVTYRQAIAALFVGPIALFFERRSKQQLTAAICGLLFISALLGGTLTQILFLAGLKLTSATFSCAFTNLVPAVTFLLALPLGLEKLDVKTKAGRAKVFGTLVCIAGAMVLTLYKGLLLSGPDHPPATDHTNNDTDRAIQTKNIDGWAIGSLLLTAACTLWSGWFLLQARIGTTFPFKYSSTAIMFFFGSIQSVILTLILERDSSKWILKGKMDIFYIVYTGIIGLGVCYAVMVWCVKQRGPLFTSAFTPLIQIFVAVFDFFFLHGHTYLGSVIGSVVVITGLYILLWGRSNEIEGTKMKQPQVTGEDG